MEHAVERLQNTGEVRHNAESTNSFLPQELDKKFLVVSDGIEGNGRCKYVDIEELQDIMCKYTDEGYSLLLVWILNIWF